MRSSGCAFSLFAWVPGKRGGLDTETDTRSVKTHRGRPCEEEGSEGHIRKPRVARARKWQGSLPFRRQRGPGPADPLISNFWSPEQRENKFPLF